MRKSPSVSLFSINILYVFTAIAGILCVLTHFSPKTLSLVQNARTSHQPPRPLPLPICPTASRLVLCERGSPNQLIFSHAERLRNGDANVPLSLESHPGFTIAARNAETGPFEDENWMVVELGVCSDDGQTGLHVQFDKSGFVTSSHAPSTPPTVHKHNILTTDGTEADTEYHTTIPSMVFDISYWNYEAGNTVNLVGSQFSNEKSRRGGGGRTFIVNNDGTISSAKAPNLVLGFDLPDVTLVNVSSENAFVFDRADELNSGTAIPLTLSSHPGYAICPQSNPQRFEEFKVYYQRLGLCDSVDHAMVVKKEGDFIVSATNSSPNFVLDVPYDKRVEGTGDIALSVIHFDKGNDKEEGNNARLFIINENNTISPVASPHLVLGLRFGTDSPIFES